VDVEVTRLGLGTAGIGNLYEAVDDETALSTVDAAWDAGIRYFDTAPHYGLGLAERRLGRALRGRPREQYVVSTKVGRLLIPGEGGSDLANGFAVPASYRRIWDFSAGGVRRGVDESLARMGLDRVDIVLLHDPEESDEPETALSQGFPALARLRDEGVVGAVGVGSKQVAILHRFVRETDIDLVMIAGRYTLLEQPALPELLPACVQSGVSVLNAGVFNSGLLATDEPGGHYEYAPPPDSVIARARTIAAVCHRHGVSLPQAALAFARRHPAVASVVVGAAGPDQVIRNAALFAAPPPEALWDDLVHSGLLPAG
jgi:D-threo-aldose 1-dehydrogenase